MTNFMQRSTQLFLIKKAVRQIISEIEKAGIEDLKTLVEAGKSIVGTYLQDCSSSEKSAYRRDLRVLIQVGVTPDMLLTEIARQMPDLAPIMKAKQNYKQNEIRALDEFLKQE